MAITSAITLARSNTPPLLNPNPGTQNISTLATATADSFYEKFGLLQSPSRDYAEVGFIDRLEKRKAAKKSSKFSPQPGIMPLSIYSRADLLRREKHFPFALEESNAAKDYLDKDENLQFNNIKDYKEFMETDMKLVQKHKVGNCDEQSGIMQYMLLKNGAVPRKIAFAIFDENGNFLTPHPHLLNIIPTNSFFDVKNSDTWLKNALAVDTWLNDRKACSLEEMMEKFKQFYGFEEGKHSIRYAVADENLYELLDRSLTELKTKAPNATYADLLK